MDELLCGVDRMGQGSVQFPMRKGEPILPALTYP